MQEQTGTTFTFTEYTDCGKVAGSQRRHVFRPAPLPDVLFKAALSVDEQIRYSDAGQLIDLMPLLAENAPNLWALLQRQSRVAAGDHPSKRQGRRAAHDQHAVAAKRHVDQPDLAGYLKLNMPTDFESLLNVLEAFQTKDPNQNGKQDEIPLSFLGPWDLKFLSHAFGLVANDYNIYVDDAGTGAVLAAGETDSSSFLKALASMYEEGLLDANGFSTADTLRAVSDSDATVTYGMFFGPNPYHLFTVDLGEQYTLLQPLAFDGKQIYRDLFGPITTGTFAITSACAGSGRGACAGWIPSIRRRARSKRWPAWKAGLRLERRRHVELYRGFAGRIRPISCTI